MKKFDEINWNWLCLNLISVSSKRNCSTENKTKTFLALAKVETLPRHKVKWRKLKFCTMFSSILLGKMWNLIKKLIFEWKTNQMRIIFSVKERKLLVTLIKRTFHFHGPWSGRSPSTTISTLAPHGQTTFLIPLGEKSKTISNERKI